MGETNKAQTSVANALVVKVNSLGTEVHRLEAKVGASQVGTSEDRPLYVTQTDTGSLLTRIAHDQVAVATLAVAIVTFFLAVVPLIVRSLDKRVAAAATRKQIVGVLDIFRFGAELLVENPMLSLSDLGIEWSHLMEELMRHEVAVALDDGQTLQRLYQVVMRAQIFLGTVAKSQASIRTFEASLRDVRFQSLPDTNPDKAGLIKDTATRKEETKRMAGELLVLLNDFSKKVGAGEVCPPSKN